MLNLFKSPKKQEIVQQDETSLIIKQFNGLNIQVYGTYEEPLFKAKDIGDLLEIKDIKSTIRDFDSDEKGVHTMHTVGGMQDVLMLKEQGLSRKPIAKRFQKWVFEVIKEIRVKGKYDLEEKLKEHQQLLHQKNCY